MLRYEEDKFNSDSMVIRDNVIQKVIEKESPIKVKPKKPFNISLGIEIEDGSSGKT